MALSDAWKEFWNDGVKVRKKERKENRRERKIRLELMEKKSIEKGALEDIESGLTNKFREVLKSGGRAIKIKPVNQQVDEYIRIIENNNPQFKFMRTEDGCYIVSLQEININYEEA